MTGFALGPMPGTSIPLAADIILGETGDLPAIPQLPERGLGSDAVGRTAALLEAIHVDRGPRSWRMIARPQLLSRTTADRLERDLDELQEAWGENLERVKVNVLGPWSLAASLELPNGHRAISDRHALEDLTAALLVGLNEHLADVARRFHGQVLLQLDEPLLADIHAGRVPGTTDFDTLPPVGEDALAARLAGFNADFLHCAPLWEAARAARTFLAPLEQLGAARDLDGLGEHLSAGHRVGFGMPAANTEDEARAAAIAIARHMDSLGMPRETLIDQVDVYPTRVGTLADAPARLRAATLTAGMLVRDAGDL